MIGGDPFVTLTSHKGTYRIEYVDGTVVIGTDDPFDALDNLIKRFAEASSGQRFVGGAIGFVGYDAKNYIEDLPDTVDDDLEIPELSFGLYDTVAVFDRVEHSAIVAACGAVDGVPGLTESAEVRAEAFVSRLKSSRIAAGTDGYRIGTVGSTHTYGEYEEMVLGCKEYIVAGDIFQANLSQRLGAPFRGDMFALYRTLRRINPSPFAFYMDCGDTHLVSCSPERLVRTRGSIVDTRPIAGTRPRGDSHETDAALHRELRLNEKEAAEAAWSLR